VSNAVDPGGMPETEDFKCVLKDLNENTEFEVTKEAECGGEPEPGCFSSMGEFRYRVWEFFARWKYILLCC
jgi:hypothetical protein